MSDGGTVQRFFGGLLVAVGVLMMLLCGGCGAVFFVGILTDELRHATRMDAGMLLMPIILGGVPAAVGLGLFAGGRSLRRAAQSGIEPSATDGAAGGDPPA